VTPRFTDPLTKYRYYSGSQFMQMDIIRAAKSMGVGLKKVKAILRERNAASIDAVMAVITLSQAPAAERGVYTREIPRRRIISRSIKTDPGFRDIVLGLSSLERVISERRLINRYETGILLAPDETGSYRPSAVFNAVELDASSDPSGISILPRGRYVCVRYDEKDALAQQAKLGAYLRRGKLNPKLILQADLLSDIFWTGPARAELQVLVLRGIAETPTYVRQRSPSYEHRG
jgi:DNA-binding transcriptional MerR regulator